MVAFLGAILIIVALGALVVQLWVSIRDRNENRNFVGDPWDGRSLEWSVSAPPPDYNFAKIPVVTDRDAFTAAKDCGRCYERVDTYAAIELPKNSAIGPVVGAIGLVLAFGLVWQIWWLVIVVALIAVAVVILSGFARDTTHIVPAEEVRLQQQRWIDAAAAAVAISRADECKSVNAGRAQQEEYTGVPV
jgi:cytochrome o ubiquinol oxidase subunit 1